MDPLTLLLLLSRARRHRLNVGTLQTLCVVREAALPAGRISREIGISSRGSTAIIDRLEALGFIERRTGRDRRKILVAITEKGRAALDEILHGTAVAFA